MIVPFPQTAIKRGPLAPSVRLFKNASRVLRFENGVDLGRRVGVMRAIELMPDIAMVKTDKQLMALAATTLKKLENYRPGGASRASKRATGGPHLGCGVCIGTSDATSPCGHETYSGEISMWTVEESPIVHMGFFSIVACG